MIILPPPAVVSGVPYLVVYFLPSIPSSLLEENPLSPLSSTSTFPSSVPSLALRLSSSSFSVFSPHLSLRFGGLSYPAKKLVIHLYLIQRKFSRETACLPRKPGTTDTSWSHHGSSQRLYPPSHRHTRPHTPAHTNTHPALSRSALPPNPCDRDRCNSRSDDTKLSAAPGWVVHQGYPPGARPPRPNQGAVPLPGRGESGAPWVGVPIWCSISQGWLPE